MVNMQFLDNFKLVNKLYLYNMWFRNKLNEKIQGLYKPYKIYAILNTYVIVAFEHCIGTFVLESSAEVCLKI